MAFADKGIGKMLKAIRTSLNPADMLGALAMGINSHEEFRKMLQAVDPEKRKVAYDVMRPRLSFKAKPLDVYISEAGQEAESKRLPTWDEKTHTTTEFVPARNADLAKVAEEVIREGVAFDASGKRLRLTCSKCTTEATFPGATIVDAVVSARKSGWVYDAKMQREICPKCPAYRPN